MNFDDLIFSKFDFSGVHKEELIPLIEELIGFSDKARKQGLLSLEDDLGMVKDPFLKMGLQLIIDGTDPELVEEILERIIFFSNATTERVLEYCIMRTGVLGIQTGNNPHVLHHQLYAYIGMEFIEEYMSQVDSHPTVRELMVNPNFIPLDISLEFNHLFTHMDDLSIQRMLREIDITVLVYALSNSSLECESKILKNISSRAAYMLTEDRQILSISLEDCIENQKMILDLYEKLVEMGEIIGTEE
jgi:chemotaxis protein MotA